jgi:transcription elongation factor S-II
MIVGAAPNRRMEYRENIEGLFRGLGLSDLEAKDLEIGIYNATIDWATEENVPRAWDSELFTEAYVTRARSIYSNLRQDSYIGNARLMTRLKEREFAPHELATMKCENTFPEKWADIVRREMLRSQNAYVVNMVAMTDKYVCAKCKSRQISYYEMQTRSADESCTIFANCIQCGYRWKM